MIWNSECRKTRRLLALCVGNDLDERDAAGVERHLAVCPDCREIRQGLHQSQQALDAVRPTAAPDKQLSVSVWPGVSRHIRSIDEQSVVEPAVAPGWHEWLPTGALAAACVAMIAALWPPVRSGESHLASESVRVIVGSDTGRLQRVTASNLRVGNRQGRPVQAPPADPDSYRNF